MKLQADLSFEIAAVDDKDVAAEFFRLASLRAASSGFLNPPDVTQLPPKDDSFAVLVRAEHGEVKGAFLFGLMRTHGRCDIHCALRTFGSRTDQALLGSLESARRHGEHLFYAWFPQANRPVQLLLERNGFLVDSIVITPDWSSQPWVFTTFV